MATKKKTKPRRTAPKVVLTPEPPPPLPLVNEHDLEIGGGPPAAQMVGADDLHEIVVRAEQDRKGRETAETQVQELSAQILTLENKLKAQRPVRFDAQKVEGVANAVYMGVLMDLKGVLTVLGLQSPEAAAGLLRVQKLEHELAPTVTAATILLQRAKALAQRRAQGLEISPEEFEDLLVNAGRLL